MIKSIKARWQAYWDGTTQPLFQADADPSPLPLGPGVSVTGRTDPYTQLAVFGHQSRPRPSFVPVGPASVPSAIPVFELADPEPVEPAAVFNLATPKQRAYEAGLSDWARECLAEMDRVVGVVLNEEYTEVRTPQFMRRTRRNFRDVMDEVGDGSLLLEDDGPERLLAHMTERRRRASASEITGLIPTITETTTEEDWA